MRSGMGSLDRATEVTAPICGICGRFFLRSRSSGRDPLNQPKVRDIVIYTTDYCPYCRAAKDLLQSKGVAFREEDVTGDDAMREKLMQMTGGRTTVPQIFVDGKALGGYDDLADFFRKGGSL